MATHVMSVTDGTTTITLTSGSWLLSDYQMAYPRRGADGTYEDVTETIELNAFGTSTTGVQTTVNALEVMLQRAYIRQATGHGAKIYLQFQVANEELTWRSELLGGEIDIGTDTLRAWNQALALVRVHIERRYYWEGPETLARIVQQYTGQSPIELTVYNYTFTGSAITNFIEFNSTSIGGVLPTPAIIRQSISYGGATRAYTDMHISIGKFKRPDLFQHMYDGREALGAGSNVTDVTSAHSTKRQIITSTTPAVVYWNSYPEQDHTGRTYRVIVRFSSYGAGGSGSVYVRTVVSMAGNTRDLWYGDEVRLPYGNLVSSSFVDIGTIPIPEARVGANPAYLLIKLAIRSTMSGTVNIDYLQLTPLDGYRILQPESYTMTNGRVIVDHGIDGVTYVEDTTQSSNPSFGTIDHVPLDSGIGPYINLFPGEAQRMYFNRTLTSGATISDGLLTRVYYRPRRLTI